MVVQIALTPAVPVTYSVLTFGQRAMSTTIGDISICLVSSVPAGVGYIVSSLSLFEAAELVVRNSKSKMTDSLAERVYLIGDRLRSLMSSTEWNIKKKLFCFLRALTLRPQLAIQ